jgi:hypothetical protein
MNSKTIIAAVVGAIAAFLLGWLVWGMLLMDYYAKNTTQYEGLMLPESEMKLWAIFISNLAGSTMTAWVFSKMNLRSFGGGFQAGLIIYALIAISFDFMFYSMMNWYANSTVIVVDILVNAVFGGIIGGIIAMMLGRGSSTAAD